MRRLVLEYVGHDSHGCPVYSSPGGGKWVDSNPEIGGDYDLWSVDRLERHIPGDGCRVIFRGARFGWGVAS